MVTEAEKGNNGHEGYGELLEGIIERGAVADAEKLTTDGIGLIQPPEVKASNAALLASVTNASNIYEKEEKLKGILLDFCARSVFRSREERIYFLDWVEWCEDFGVGYDGPLRWLISVISENGESRKEYVDAITITRLHSNYRGNYGQQQNKYKPKYKEGELT